MDHMRRVIRAVIWAVAGSGIVLGILLASRLSLNALHTVTRGARPLRVLAAEGELPVRAAAQAALRDLATKRYARGTEWVAVVTPAMSRDTVVLALFRAEDATLRHRLWVPDPAVSGVARYSVPESRLVYLGVGVR